MLVTEAPGPSGRFPAGQSRFGIHTLAEEIELIHGLNKTMGRDAGIYPEIKSPWFHHQEGKDSTTAILNVLKRYGYKDRDDKVYLQTFDFNELARIRTELFPELNMDIKLVQLIARNDWRETYELIDGQWQPYDYDWMHTREGMNNLAQFADGVGPALDMIVDNESTQDHVVINSFVQWAHEAGLRVHPFTFRKDPGRLPEYAKNFEHLLDIFLNQADVDGVFTDFPDSAVQFISNGITE